MSKRKTNGAGLKCPKCGSDDPDGFNLVENLIGTAGISINGDGTYVYVGETAVDWNSQRTLTAKSGRLRVACDCGHEFWTSKLKGESDADPSGG